MNVHVRRAEGHTPKCHLTLADCFRAFGLSPSGPAVMQSYRQMTMMDDDASAVHILPYSRKRETNNTQTHSHTQNRSLEARIDRDILGGYRYSIKNTFKLI